MLFQTWNMPRFDRLGFVFLYLQCCFRNILASWKDLGILTMIPLQSPALQSGLQSLIGCALGLSSCDSRITPCEYFRISGLSK